MSDQDQDAGALGGRGRRSPDEPLYAISVAAELTGCHPQTLRTYEREGLVEPKRSAGNVRRYSDRDIARLVEIQRLTQEQGLNLSGVKMVLELRDAMHESRRRVARVEAELEEMTRRLRDEVAEAHRSHRFEIVPLERGSIELYWMDERRRRGNEERRG